MSSRALQLRMPIESRKASVGCQIEPVGKRRDGGTRYWCMLHKADATAKYGKRAKQCRAAHLEPISDKDTFALNLDQYAGGVALWGAVPAIYDTTRLPMDRGIHVHARKAGDEHKEIDRTFREVRVIGKGLPEEGVLISELDAIYYMVTAVFGYDMRDVRCTYCGYPHLDKDYFSVHPHSRHLCAGCGKHFRDDATAVGNPIAAIRQVCMLSSKPPKAVGRRLEIKQADYPGGIQIWGSNPSFFWTGDKQEEEGIHVHAFKTAGAMPPIDETYGEVVIDGIRLDPLMVRVFMAQNTMPSLKGRIRSVSCPKCHKPHFDKGENAFNPRIERQCENCRKLFSPQGRLRKVISNPIAGLSSSLAAGAPRPPQIQDLGLLPETL